MANTRVFIDHTTTSYDRRNVSHHAFINQQINDFQSLYAELLRYDNRSESLMGLLGLTWLFGSLGTVSALLLGTSFLCVSHEFFGRPDIVKRYQDQLNELYELYEWCAKSGGKAITDDKPFLLLAKTLLPFISYADLKKPFTDLNNISEAFAMLIVNDSLHRSPFLKERQAAPRGFFTFFSSRSTEDDPVMKTGVNLEGDDFNHRRQHAYAESRFLMYGRETVRGQSMAEKANGWLGPVKALVYR